MERDYPYTLTGPEIELIEMVRLAHVEDFTLSIEHGANAFRITVTDTLQGKGLKAEGQGFEECWRGLTHPDVAHLGLTMDEKIAARGLPSGQRGAP